MSDYKNLSVWQKSHGLVLEVYRLTAGFPLDEKYGIVSQMRRASVSIPTNISEGHGRLYKKEYVQFLNIARGSASELEYLLILAADLGYVDESRANELIKRTKEILRMLNGLIKSIKHKG